MIPSGGSTPRQTDWLSVAEWFGIGLETVKGSEKFHWHKLLLDVLPSFLYHSTHENIFLPFLKFKILVSFICLTKLTYILILPQFLIHLRQQDWRYQCEKKLNWGEQKTVSLLPFVDIQSKARSNTPLSLQRRLDESRRRGSFSCLAPVRLLYCQDILSLSIQVEGETKTVMLK